MAEEIFVKLKREVPPYHDAAAPKAVYIASGQHEGRYMGKGSWFVTMKASDGKLLKGVHLQIGASPRTRDEGVHLSGVREYSRELTDTELAEVSFYFPHMQKGDDAKG